MTDDILFSMEGPWGVVKLNRPQALNSLTLEMCRRLDVQLAAWESDDAIKAVLVEGEGDRAFCAGGDIRALAETGAVNPNEAADFFRVEYLMNARIAAYSKPYVAVMDGVTMGGGVGISMSASHRIVTERTKWAMPECGIGLIPDVGASFMLPRLPGGMGNYLALTGARLNGADCITAAVATHHISSDQLDSARGRLLAISFGENPYEDVSAILDPLGESRPGDLVMHLREIDTLFMTIPEISTLLGKLRKEGTEFATKSYNLIRPSSPTSLAITRRLLADAPETFNACIAREFNIVAHLMDGHDFYEGVRAQIIDKDRAPTWSPVRHDDVIDSIIDPYFEVPEGGPLDLSGLG